LHLNRRPHAAPLEQNWVTSHGAPSSQHAAQVVVEFEAQSPVLDTISPGARQAPLQQCCRTQLLTLHSPSIRQEAPRPFLAAHRLPSQNRFPLQSLPQQGCPEFPQATTHVPPLQVRLLPQSVPSGLFDFWQSPLQATFPSWQASPQSLPCFGLQGVQPVLELSQPNMHFSVSIQDEPSGPQVCTALEPHRFVPGLHVPLHAPLSQA
jgi:hypothetical protein